MAASRASTSAELGWGGSCIARKIAAGDPTRASGMSSTSELNCSRASCWTLLRRAAAIPSRLRARSSGISIFRFAICARSPGHCPAGGVEKPSSLALPRPDQGTLSEWAIHREHQDKPPQRRCVPARLPVGRLFSTAVAFRQVKLRSQLPVGASHARDLNSAKGEADERPSTASDLKNQSRFSGSRHETIIP